jgi:hypothetical protein
VRPRSRDGRWSGGESRRGGSWLSQGSALIIAARRPKALPLFAFLSPGARPAAARRPAERWLLLLLVLRSLTFDKDVDFTNDYRLLGLGDKAHLFIPPTGYALGGRSIRDRLVPLLRRRPRRRCAALKTDQRQRRRHVVPVSAGGASRTLLRCCCWFTFRFVALFFARRMAALATTLAVAGSFMLWYIVKEPSMTHAPSMAGAAALAWMWAATRRRTLRTGRARRVASHAVRWQNRLRAVALPRR